MKTQVWGVAAAAVVLLTAAARGEETLRTTQGVSCVQDETNCTRFRSYVYVRRAPNAAAPVRSLSGAAAPGVVERRVYLNMGAAEAR